MKIGVVIVAGGSGTRMGTDTPKQFLLLHGQPVLMHTVRRFSEVLPEAGLTVVLPEEQLTLWAALCEEHGFTVDHTVVCGGTTRFDSVRNGLSSVSDCDYIGVHDGVRPLVSAAVIRGTLEAAQDFGAAIPVVPVSDSLREVLFCGTCQDMSEILGSNPVDRNRFVAVQTPQFFRGQILLKSYEQDYAPEFTDDASVVEAAGYSVTLASGDPVNLKITHPADLTVAEALIKKGVR